MVYVEVQGYIQLKRFEHHPSPNGPGIIREVLEKGRYVTVKDYSFKLRPIVGDSIKVADKEYAKITEIIWESGGVMRILADYAVATEEDDETWVSRQKALDDQADWTKKIEKREGRKI